MRWITSIALGVAAAVLIAAAVAAGGESARTSRSLTLRAFIRDAQLDYVDLGRPGDSEGDMLVKDSAVYNASNTKRIGRSPISCVLVDLRRPPRCNAEVRFRSGTIATQGELGQPRFVFAVTGGTGRFTRAHGEMVGRIVGHGHVRLTLRLSGVRR